MRPFRRLLAALLLGLAVAPAQAGTQELRLSLARLIETLDAGLSRGDLRALRIDINAEIRVQKLVGLNSLAEIDEMSRALNAADQVWTLLLASQACQPPAAGAAVKEPAACQAQLATPLQEFGLAPPDLTQPLNQQAVLQPALQALRRQAERTLRNLR